MPYVTAVVKMFQFIFSRNNPKFVSSKNFLGHLFQWYSIKVYATNNHIYSLKNKQCLSSSSKINMLVISFDIRLSDITPLSVFPFLYCNENTKITKQMKRWNWTYTQKYTNNTQTRNTNTHRITHKTCHIALLTLKHALTRKLINCRVIKEMYFVFGNKNILYSVLLYSRLNHPYTILVLRKSFYFLKDYFLYNVELKEPESHMYVYKKRWSAYSRWKLCSFIEYVIRYMPVS